MAVPALGYWLIISRTRSGNSASFRYLAFEDRADFLAAWASPATLAEQPFRRRTPFGFDSTFLIQGAGVQATNTAAVPTTDDGTPTYEGPTGGGSGSSPDDSAMQTLSAQRLVSLDNKLHTDEAGNLLVSLREPQKLRVDVLNSTLDVNIVSESSLAYGAATEVQQQAIEAQLAAILDQLVLAAQQSQQSDALTDTELRAAPLHVVLDNPSADYATTTGQAATTRAVQAVGDKLPAPVNGRVPVDVNLPNPLPVSGSVTAQVAFPSVQAVSVQGEVEIKNDAGNPLAVAVTFPVNQQVSQVSQPLPTGAATAANQNLEITALNSLDTKVATSALQTAGNASLANLDSKVATAAKQDIANTALQTIAAGTPPLVGGAVPVVGNLTINNAAPATVYTSSSLAGTPALIKNAPAQLYSVHVTNTTTTLRYLNIFNQATTPTTGSVPAISFAIPAGQTFRFSLDGKYITLTNGLGITIGTAPSLGTLVGGLVSGIGANDLIIVIQYA
ncbi:hypothetical protein [Hymenobacter glacieicola]|uniref:Tail fiber protein n=1 Tax=Hymenobacter glacieicola TaxID=1562124 RepID=A0ABQ1X5B7_9BACT|nr:hypothetical protein [Hymenobacter glacieicola]GGG60729.1 hypothetical protein GCM10011378_40950 [Hymenobacter glacieicola]